jgi:phosphatidylcholine synthase
MSTDIRKTNNYRNKIPAAFVHLITAAGSIVGLLGFAACGRGEWRTVYILMLLTILIDAADGSLARKFRVKELLPQIDGALMDNLVDFVNYSLLPAFVLLQSDLLPVRFRLLGASLVLLSSCYQFSQTNAKTDDHFFKGFPSYWNLLVIYLALLKSHPTTNILAIIVCTLLTFIPIYYVYPSRTPVLKKLTLWLSLPWIILLAWAVIISGPGSAEAYSYPVTLISLIYIIYYLILSLYLTFRRFHFEPRFPVKHL